MPSREHCCTTCAHGIGNSFTKYDTARVASFKSPFIAVCNRLIQGIILVYIIGYVFIKEKGYQEMEIGESSVVTKVKGNQRNIRRGYTGENMFPVGEDITWDPADVVVPPLENNALFIMTRFSMTEKQLQGKCPERLDTGNTDAVCIYDSDCQAGKSIHLGHGFLTGKCIAELRTCEVYAWCPLEKDTDASYTLLDGAQELTILVKNFVLFPNSGVRRRNIGELSQHYIRKCLYHPKKDPLCPIFRLGDIIDFAKENFTAMATVGAVINFGISWKCNLDLHVKNCLPTYSFRRLDESIASIYPGWSFWYSGYWNDPHDNAARYVIKATGIRIVFTVDATAGKFHIVRFTMNLGSSLGLLGMATMLCDYFLFHCTAPEKRRKAGEYTTLEVKYNGKDVLPNGKRTAL